MNIARLMTNLQGTLLAAGLLLFASTPVNAQRFTDNLDRGLVAVKLADVGNGIGTFISWRRLPQEYIGVKYNLYYNGSLLASDLETTNYTHTHNITGEEMYQVAAVVKGVEQDKCDPFTVWSGWAMYRNGERRVGGCIDITLSKIFSRGGVDMTDTYSPNDIEMADLDGDGDLEIIIKRLSTTDANALYVDMDDPAYDVFEAYDVDWQSGEATRLWWIDVGANMVSGASTEVNIIAYDWDGDGMAEALLRGADDMIIHYTENGVEKEQAIGTKGLSYRSDVTHIANATYTHTGAEYLIYLNGKTGKPYPIGTDSSKPWIDYPLPRLESGETDLADAWWYSAQYNGGKTGVLGHRDSKYFMGAPFLDGRKASIFLGRGIYTRHKMIALDVDASSHKLTERWRWSCNDNTSPWFGNGYHNFIVADVDEDGRDEIVYGSMVIDDNGCGLSTTGYQHGDAQHVSDFDPYRKGLEFFGCLEDGPYYGCNYRDATTSKVYYKHTATADDGRALMANFSNDYPGSMGRSASSSIMSSVTDGLLSDIPDYLPAGNLNFRIYWDGDLLSEWQDSPGTSDGLASIEKPGVGRIFNASGMVNQYTKHNTCFSGDIIGDWREEMILRVDANTIRVWTSGISSDYSIPSLWFDHQYRQAMVWQMMAYNQPPHLSYFLGELEGYTTAPPPYTLTGRTEIGNGGTIGSGLNGEQLLACETGNMTISVTDGVRPTAFFDNAPSWVQGTDVNGTSGTKVKTDGSIGVTNLPPINRTNYTHTVTGGAFAGDMYLAKQGDGTLILPSVTETYTGNTDVWAGTLQFDGTMQNSPVWMNRHTTLNTTGGTFNNGLTMEYGATLNVGGDDCSRVNISALTLNYGARVVLDVNGMGDAEHDWLNAITLNIDDTKKGVSAWENYGPQYITPVFQIRMQTTLGEGRYPIGNVTTVNGDLSAIVLENDLIGAEHLSLEQENGVLYLRVSDVATANEATIALTGMAPYENVATHYPSILSSDYYLPVVSIVANNTDGQAPTLSGTFTPFGGTETSIGSTAQTMFYNQDYENETDESSWTNRDNDVLELITGDATHGKYIHHNTRTTNNRSAYTLFNCNLNNQSKYILEFDAAIQVGNVADRSATDFVVMTQGAVIPTTINQGYDYNGDRCNSPGTGYLLRLHAAQSQEFTINESSSTVTLAASTWYHYKIDVDTQQRTAAYTITSGSTTITSGTFNIPDGTSCYPQGLFILDGRGAGDSKFDNIVIKSADDDMSSYTFTEPGTLRVYSSVDGYASGIKTFEADYPFIKTGNSGNISNDYLPVAIHDEQATILPQTVSTTGNAHLWRNGLTNISTWATMVVPFDMTVAQVREVFGGDVTVANLETGKGNGSQIYFETIEVETANDNITAITANKPCLIKGVTKSAPYLIMGITSEPVQEPSVTNGHFTFVGTYIDLGQQAFTTNDYFFTTSGLSRVETNGTTMRLKGYRGYFEGLTANGAKNIQTVFEKSDVATEILDIPTTTRNEVYDLQGRKIPENWRQKKGVYIVNGRKMIVK